jgi:hypothetical protein
MKTVYALKMRHKIGPCVGYVGYHSVYQDKLLAKHMEKLRNKLHGNEFEYFVVPMVPTRSGHNHRGDLQVGFKDSMMMIVDTHSFEYYMKVRWSVK